MFVRKFEFKAGVHVKAVLTSLACIASVSVGLGSKERPRNGTGMVVCPRKIGVRAKLRKRGWGRGRQETLADKPLDFENLSSLAREWLNQ